jgi:hypothetical protein
MSSVDSRCAAKAASEKGEASRGNPESSDTEPDMPRLEKVSTITGDGAEDTMAFLSEVEKAVALTVPAEYFANGYSSGRAAWKTNQDAALTRGVELSLSSTGKVQAQSVAIFRERRRYQGDSKLYTLAETIEFVFAQSGSLGFAFRMWRDEMR